MSLFKQRKFYDRWTFDEFMQYQEDMFDIGLSVSARRGDYGKSTCLNCRAIVDVGVPGMTGRYYGKQHRLVCGDQNLTGAVRGRMQERLDAIGNWWARDAATTGMGEP
jgi:hypothetical protein